MVTGAEFEVTGGVALQPGSHLIYRRREIKRGGKGLPPVTEEKKAI
jgi:hypothetical protein